MSVVKYTTPALRGINRDEFLTPFDKLFDDVFSQAFPDFTKEFGVGFFEKQSYPRVDVIDNVDSIEIIAEIPGLSKDEVSVEIEDNLLIISGQKTKTVDSNDKRTYIRKELKHSSFKRTFALSDLFDKDTPEAKFENGLLTVKVKKVKPTPPTSKKVKIT
jgi:HSP20 family protein